jgi:hypothetical protein
MDSHEYHRSGRNSTVRDRDPPRETACIRKIEKSGIMRGILKTGIIRFQFHGQFPLGSVVSIDAPERYRIRYLKRVTVDRTGISLSNSSNREFFDRVVWRLPPSARLSPNPLPTGISGKKGMVCPCRAECGIFVS